MVLNLLCFPFSLILLALFKAFALPIIPIAMLSLFLGLKGDNKCFF